MTLPQLSRAAAEHRPHDSAMNLNPLALVVRPIKPGSPEFQSAGCQQALRSELDRLRARVVWDESRPREWQEVRKDPRNAEVMCGRVFPIVGEKDSELASLGAKYKARVVFQGNWIQTKTGTPASEIFEEVSNTPATMTSARLAMAVGALKAMNVSVRDAEQAYVQSRIDGPERVPAWVRLPKGWWPKSWFAPNGDPKFQDPVVRLCRSLHGHPESGALWEGYLSERLVRLGWRLIEGFPGLWLHGATEAILVVYVDDLLLTASAEHEVALWAAIESPGVSFKDPAIGIDRYLGVYRKVTKSASGLVSMAVSMGTYLAVAVSAFEEEAGGPVKTRQTPAPDDLSHDDEEPVGRYAKCCASHVMKIMYAARMARPDLITAVTRLSAYLTKWRRTHDAALEQLMGFIKLHAGGEMVSSLSTKDIDKIELVMWPDADLAGCKSSGRSTSGLWIEFVAGGHCWPLAWSSKRQTCIASSTAESEVVSLATGLRHEATPLLFALSQILNKPVMLRCKEDNTQAIAAVKRGYSGALRAVSRNQRISLALLHHAFKGSDATMEYCPTSQHKGDSFTKPLARAPFHAAAQALGIRYPRMETQGGCD